MLPETEEMRKRTFSVEVLWNRLLGGGRRGSYYEGLIAKI